MSKRKGSDDSTDNDPQPPSKRSQCNQAGFHVACTRHPPTQPATITTSMSRITMLALRTSGNRFRPKHRERSHTPAALLPQNPTPASLPQASLPDNASIHTEDNSVATNAAKPKCSRNHNAQVCNHHQSIPIDVLTSFIGKAPRVAILFRDATLDEILQHDGLGDFLRQLYCMEYEHEDSIFKCKDCSGGCQLCCQNCLVKLHQHSPLHRI